MPIEKEIIMKYLSSVFVAACVSNSALAGVIYDQDSQSNRVSTYTHGPVSKVEVVTSNSRYFQGFYETQGVGAECSHVAIFDDVAGYKIGDLNISDVAFYGEVPEGNIHNAKSLRLTCQVDGVDYVVHHKVPGAPKVTLESNIVASQWQPIFGRTPGHYKDVQYSASVFIDNQADDGQCYVADQVGKMPKALPLHPEVIQFNTNHFTMDGAAYYDAYRPFLVKMIFCSNAGGTTILGDEWTFSQSQEGKISHEIWFNYR